MVIFSLSLLTSEPAKLIASFVAGSAAVRAWFGKEIKAGRAWLAEEEAKVAADVKKVETAVKKI